MLERLLASAGAYPAKGCEAGVRTRLDGGRNGLRFGIHLVCGGVGGARAELAVDGGGRQSGQCRRCDWGDGGYVRAAREGIWRSRGSTCGREGGGGRDGVGGGVGWEGGRA